MEWVARTPSAGMGEAMRKEKQLRREARVKDWFGIDENLKGLPDWYRLETEKTEALRIGLPAMERVTSV